MKYFFPFLISLLSLSPVLAQKIIQKGGERVNSFVKSENSIKVEILLENGANEKVPTKITVATDNMSQEDIDMVLSWTSIITINTDAKYTCANKRTYKPLSIFMYKSEGEEISGQLKGEAKNAYGVEGDVRMMFSFKDGKAVPN